MTTEWSQNVVEREDQVFERCFEAFSHVRWETVHREVAGLGTASFMVMAEPLMIDGVLPTGSAILHQRIADAMALSLITPTISDTLYNDARWRLDPVPLSSTTSTQRMLEHSEKVVRQLDETNREGIISGGGKDTVIGKRRTGSLLQYGWHAPGSGSWRGIPLHKSIDGKSSVIQPLASTHNQTFTNYCRTIRLMGSMCGVNGDVMTVQELLCHPTLWRLGCHDGPLTPADCRYDVADPTPTPVPEDRPTPPAPAPPKPAATKPATWDEPSLSFIPSRNFTKANRPRSSITFGVTHTMETGSHLKGAEAVANWFAGPNAPQASVQYCVDGDSAIQCVLEQDVAWHAKSGNRTGVGIEHAGYARYVKEWNELWAKNMFVISAGIMAGICMRNDLPIRRLTVDQVKRYEKGICDHYAITKAFNVKGGHIDVGKGWPWERYLELVDRRYQELRGQT